MNESHQRVLGDWGTSRLRLYLTSGGTIEATCEGPGIGAIPGAPLDVLRASLASWQAHTSINRVTLCGMAGSRNGLIEVPYVPVPAGIDEWRQRLGRLEIPGLTIEVCAGMSQINAAAAPDVMRGEETQIFGAMRMDPRLAAGHHRLVLPGTHSKWVDLRDGAVVGFTTYISGELFALLRDHSTLLRTGGTGKTAGADTAVDAGGFDTGLARSENVGCGLAAAAFETRAGQLLSGRTHGWAQNFLSGLLIGAEVHAALERDRTNQPVIVVGDPRLAGLYRTALDHYRQPSELCDGNQAAIAGLLSIAAIHDPGS